MILTLAFVFPASAEEPAAVEVVKALFTAFNEHDPDGMAKVVSDDFELYYMTDGKAELGTQGPESLRAEMADYFEGLPTVSLRGRDRDGERLVRVVQGDRSLAARRPGPIAVQPGGLRSP